MREALGSSMLFNLILIFTSVFIALMIGSIAYSKGFKVRNRIIDIIEKYDGYDKDAISEINENLMTIGYRNVGGSTNCSDHNGNKALENNSPYDYCIYRFTTSKGDYYGVTVYVQFDVPIIGAFLKFPLYGETRVLFNKNEVEG